MEAQRHREIRYNNQQVNSMFYVQFHTTVHFKKQAFLSTKGASYNSIGQRPMSETKEKYSTNGAK